MAFASQLVHEAESIHNYQETNFIIYFTRLFHLCTFIFKTWSHTLFLFPISYTYLPTLRDAFFVLALFKRLISTLNNVIQYYFIVRVLL